MRWTAGIVGTGRMAEVLGKALVLAPDPMLRIRFLMGRDPGRTAELGEALGAEALALGEDPPGVDLLLIAVRDDALEEVCGGLARAPWTRGVPKLVFHGSGSRGLEVLEDFRARGSVLGVLHPLFSLQPGMEMKDRIFVLSGDREARALLESLVRSLGGLPRYVPDLDPALYHCAASMLANGATALYAAGLELLQEASGGALGKEEAKRLMRASLEALDQGEAARVLTGPVQRGDLETVARHLESLEKHSPQQQRLYRALMGFALSLAARGGLAEGLCRDLALLLEEEGDS
ncbi:MAG TPA: DUF2520 domain-containing protein [Planctomycetes bacterium]|nr:DUF2520 domain-containing protein [Planctomycetota bacterium]